MAKMVTFSELMDLDYARGKGHDLSIGYSLLDTKPLQFRFRGYTVTRVHDECYRMSTRSSSLLVTSKDVLVFTDGYILVGKIRMDSTL